jgi:LacI family transcriptional regulator
MLSSRPRVTMREIAAKFGVSHATVSLALRNHPRISAKLREDIQRKAAEMGYSPDPLLTVLSHYRHNRQTSPVQAAIAWINCWAHPKDLRALREFDAYWHGASDCAKKFGYHLEEFVVDKTMPLTRLEKIFITRNIKGILIPPHRDAHGLDKFNFEHFSAVRLGRTVQAPAMHVVTADQAANTAMAFQVVREKGYKRIGFAGTHHSQRLFTAGFLHAQLDVPPAERLPVCRFATPLDRTRAQKDLVSWIQAHKPEVIITESPDVPSLLTEAGYRVPQDIALAGTSIADGNISAGIDQNSYEVGRVAMLMVISLINDFAQGIPPIFRQILVEGKWIDGPECPTRKKGKG